MRSSTDLRTSLSLRHAVAAVLALSAATLYMQQATAQEATSGDVTTLSDVDVVEDPLRALSNEPSQSSFGFAKPLLETPRTVTFISEEQLRLFSVSTVADLTRLVPGTYTTTRYGLQGGINVRGVSADMYYRGMKRLNMQGHVRTVLSAYDNIEVVKGPPSPLYGMGKIGGYQNLDPKSNRAKTGKYNTKESGYVSGTVDSYEKAEMQFGLGVPFRVGNRAAGAYIVALLENSKTYVENVGAKQRFLQGTMSLDNAIGPFRLEAGGQIQNSVTSGAYMNRVTQELIDSGKYISGKPMVNLDLDGDGRVGYVETYVASPVSGTGSNYISGNNQALQQRYNYRVRDSGKITNLKNTIVGVPENLQEYLTDNASRFNCAAATALINAPTMQSNAVVSRTIPVGFYLDPCTVKKVDVNYRANGAYEREQNAWQRMGYIDLVYDVDPNFTVKNQIFYDSLRSFKDSWLPYGENQGIHAIEDKITVTKKLPAEWLPDWLGINSLGSVNYRNTAGFIRSSGGDFDYRQDVMSTNGADGSGTGGHTPNTMFWTQLTNASYATGVPATTWRISDFSEMGLGLMFDIDIFRKTNLLIGGRYDKTHAAAEDTDLFNPNTGSMNIDADQYRAGACQSAGNGCPGGYTARKKVYGSDEGSSWSASLSHQLPWANMRPYITMARSTLTLDGSNNLFATGTVSGGKLVGEAEMLEAGVKGTAFRGKAQWTLAAFNQTRNDVSSPSDPSLSVEVTSTETKGVEASFNWQTTKKLMMSLSGTYMESKYLFGADNTQVDVNARDLGFQDVVDANGNVLYYAEAYMYGGRTQINLYDPDNVYDEVPGMPKIQAAFTANYTLPKGFGLMLGGQYFSESWATRLQTETIPAATVVNIGATWDKGRLHAKLNGFNVLDKTYFQATSGGNRNMVTVMPDQRWEASLKVDF